MTGETIDASDKTRSYEIGENEFLLTEDQDLAQARRAPVARLDFACRTSPPESPPDDPERAAEGQSIRVRRYEQQGPQEPEGAAGSPVPRPRNTRTIEIERCFLPTGQIDARYYEKPYYIVPREPFG